MNNKKFPDGMAVRAFLMENLCFVGLVFYLTYLYLP